MLGSRGKIARLVFSLPLHSAITPPMSHTDDIFVFHTFANAIATMFHPDSAISTPLFVPLYSCSDKDFDSSPSVDEHMLRNEG